MNSLFLLLFVTTSAFAAPPPSNPPGGQLLRYRLSYDAVSLDWNLGDVPVTVIQNTQRGLYRVDVDGKLVRDLVEYAQTSNDGRVWVFKLKSGVFWSDGVPVSAEHCVASLKRLLDPQLASTYAYLLYDVEGASQKRASSDPKIRVLDSARFEIRLSRPMPGLPSILSHWTTYPIRSDLLTRYRDHFTNPEHMAFTGPFRVTELRPQIRVVMERNQKAEKPAKLLRLEGWILANDSTSVRLYDGSHLEFVSDPGIGATHHPDLRWKQSPALLFVGVGSKHPLTSSRAGILALSAALDRSLIPKVFDAPHRPSLGYVPPEIWSTIGEVPDDVTLDTISLGGSTSLAKNLLKEAGWESGAKVPPITLRYSAGPQMQELAEWLQERWRTQLGIQVELEGTDSKSYSSQLLAKPAALFISSQGTYSANPDIFFRLFLSNSDQNYGHWSDTEYDEWVTKANAADSNSVRRSFFIKASRRLLIEKPAIIPLYYRATGYLIKPFVRDVEINPMSRVDFGNAYTETKPSKATE